MTTSNPPRPTGGRDDRLLARLNRRGFRLVMLLDILALSAIIVGVMVIRFGLHWPTFDAATYLFSFGIVTILFTLSWYYGGLYEREPRLGAPATLPRAARQALAAGGVVALLNLGLTGFAQQMGYRTIRALPFPVINLLLVIALGAVAVTVNRWFVSWLRTQREGPPRVVLAGTDEERDLARHHLEANQSNVRIVAEVAHPAEVLGVVEQHGATDVMLVSATWLDDWFPDINAALDGTSVTTLMRVTGRETMFGLSRIREVGGMPFVLLQTQTVPHSKLRFKRLLDLVLLIGSAPLWIVIGAGVTIYQLAVAGRPLIYRQDRVGQGGEPFSMMKFRTMREDAEDADGPQLSATDDPRVIRACRWVRATRADELPQLLHILAGTMSIVGPRPERPDFTTMYERTIPGYALRHAVPPGLTGLAQIHGRYHTDAAYKLGYDLQYVVNWSPILDLEIIARTVWVVLSRRV